MNITSGLQTVSFYSVMNNVTNNKINGTCMAKRKAGLVWLDTSDENVIEWAYNYLRAHSKPAPGIYGQRNAETLLKWGARLEQDEKGREMLLSMRNAYRQVKWRMARPDLRNRTFRLHRPVAAKLDALAKKERATPTDLVERLITDTAKAYAELSRKFKESKQREKDEKLKANIREKSHQACLAELEAMLSEALMKISHYETICCPQEAVHGPLSSDSQKSAHSHYHHAWTEAQDKLEAVRKQHAGTHEITRAMERPQ